VITLEGHKFHGRRKARKLCFPKQPETNHLQGMGNLQEFERKNFKKLIIFFSKSNWHFKKSLQLKSSEIPDFQIAKKARQIRAAEL